MISAVDCVRSLEIWEGGVCWLMPLDGLVVLQELGGVLNVFESEL